MTGELTQELRRVLPRELPHRERILAGAQHHAELVLAANERLNLTRITAPRDVAIKHVLDSLLPWQRLLELLPPPAAPPSSASAAPIIADLGSGAGYPGLLLAMLLPHVRVQLVESVQKKAAFLADAVKELRLANAEIHAVRIEDLLAARDSALPLDFVVARAIGSARDLLRLLKPVRAKFRRLVLYKGPAGRSLEQELAQAAKDAEKLALVATVSFRGELPDGAGARSLVEYAAA